jgi:hypothetical protein
MLKYFLFFTIVVLIFSTNFSMAQSEVLIWNGNSEELVEFIKSRNEYHQTFALQKIIMNPENVKANYVGYDIYKMYRNHKNEKIRQMALVALYRMEHYWLLKNLQDDLYNEKNPEIRRQIIFILERMPILSELN